MLVWRVETKKGKGPYTIDGNKIQTALASDMADKHRGPSHPAWGYIHKNGVMEAPDFAAWAGYLSGFQSLEQLKKWFRGYLRKLKAAGFLIVKYEVADEYVHVGESGRQVVFRKEGAVKVA